MRKSFYIYQFSLAEILANTTLTDIISLQNDADFEITAIAVSADLSGAVQTDSTRVLPLITMQINDSGSGANLFEEPVPLMAFTANGKPFDLPTPRTIKGNGNLVGTFANYASSSAYNNLYVTLIGNKVYP